MREWDLPIDKISAIVTLAKEIVFDMKIPQRVLYDEITKRLGALCSESDYILYNDCYGGFSFSTSFKNFVHTHSDTQRIDMYEPIKAYGRHIAEMYPILFDIIYTYHTHDYAHDFQVCSMYLQEKSTYDIFDHNVKLLHSMLEEHGNIHMQRRWMHSTGNNYMCWFRYTKMNKDDFILDFDGVQKDTYTIMEAIQYVEKEMQHVDKKVHDLKECINELCMETLTYIESRPTRDTPKNKNKHMEFHTALETYGVQHHATWEYQCKYNYTYINHIILHKLYETTHETSHDELRCVPQNKLEAEECYVSIGLLCVSGAHASLAFQKVPKGLSWSLHEYDGKECIIID